MLCIASLLLGLPSIQGWTLSLPRKVIYIDSGIDWNNPANTVTQACSSGFNVVNFAFYISSGPADMATAWASLPPASQQAAIATCHAKNVAVMVSYGGATESPYASNPTTAGQTVANWALANNLDGVDFDLENLEIGMQFGSMSGQQVVNWLSTATNAARAVLGPSSGNKFISHAPQAPYFGPIGGSLWPGSSGGYSGVYANAASAIDWLSVQFYNQGGSCYTTEAGLFTLSSSDCTDFPGTSVAEIVSYGIPASKVVVGKYDPSSAASNGFVSAATLSPWLGRNANGGAMIWQWVTSAQASAWVGAAYPAGSSLAPSARQTFAPSRAPSTLAAGTAAPSRTPSRAPSALTSGTAAPTSGSAVSSCSAAGQGSLCSIACAGSCRGFPPYYGAGCLDDSTCAAPPAGATLCTCAAGTSTGAPTTGVTPAPTRTPSTLVPGTAAPSRTPSRAPSALTSGTVAPSRAPSVPLTPKPSLKPTVLPTSRPTAPSLASGEKLVNAVITGYGAPDNCPPGPVESSHLNGDGSFANPITTAANFVAAPQGTKIYVSSFQKYFIVDDSCTECDADFARGIYHFDLWVGPTSGFTGSMATLIGSCENCISGNSQVIINAANGRPVNLTPLFNTATNQCIVQPCSVATDDAAHTCGNICAGDANGCGGKTCAQCAATMLLSTSKFLILQGNEFCQNNGNTIVPADQDVCQAGSSGYPIP